jgi:hypothetical protein
MKLRRRCWFLFFLDPSDEKREVLQWVLVRLEQEQFCCQCDLEDWDEHLDLLMKMILWVPLARTTSRVKDLLHSLLPQTMVLWEFPTGDQGLHREAFLCLLVGAENLPESHQVP